jgi:hypothetical protein
MEEGVISMLYESGMPTAFLGEALAAFIHTSNRFSTSALPDWTPHEAFYGSKPVLECDLEGALESHRTQGDCRGRVKTKGEFSVLCSSVGEVWFGLVFALFGQTGNQTN